MLGLCVPFFDSMCVLVFVFPSPSSVVCMCCFIFIRDDVRASVHLHLLALTQKQVLQVHETSERERKSGGRLQDVSKEHLSLLTNPSTKPKETP